MPNLIIPIMATYESVTRLATHSVVRQVMERTGLSESVPIRFPGENNADIQPGSASIGDGPANLFEHHSRVKITVEEEYKDDAVINSAVRQGDSPYIFEDKALRTMIKPIYSHTAMAINFEYRASTRNEVEAWRNDIKVRLADNRAGMLHELDYHYEVPSSCIAILAHLHELREAQAGYGEDLGTWWRDKFTKRATLLTKMDGISSLMVIAEKAIGIQGWFEFIEPNQAEKDSAGASWTVNFIYRFHYQKPVSVNFIYPLVVHNQLIDSRLFSTKPPYSLDDRPALATESKAAFDSVSALYRKPPDPMGGLRTPSWDDWVPEQVPNYTTSLATWLIQVDREDPTLLMDMDKLGDVTLVPHVRTFLVSEYSKLTNRGKALIYFNLYRGLLPVPDNEVYMNEKLELRTREPLDLRQTYHVRMGTITELSLLDKPARNALQSHGCATLLIWQSLFPDLDVEYAYKSMIAECALSWKYCDWFFQYIRDLSEGNTVPNTGGHSHNAPDSSLYRSYYIEWPLVSILTIVTKHKEAS